MYWGVGCEKVLLWFSVNSELDKDINNPKGRCVTRLSNWKHPRDALWAFCEETNTCGRGFDTERHLKISVT
jgi:hypothetical protein